MARTFELAPNQAALVIDTDGCVEIFLDLDDTEEFVPATHIALVAIALQLQDNPLFMESLLEWAQEKLGSLEAE